MRPLVENGAVFVSGPSSEGSPGPISIEIDVSGSSEATGDEGDGPSVQAPLDSIPPRPGRPRSRPAVASRTAFTSPGFELDQLDDGVGIDPLVE